MSEHLIGVISDTHGLLRPEAVNRLHGVEQIFHTGDIGKAEVLAELGLIAPVTAVRGNNDRGDWAAEIPETQTSTVGGVRLYMLHDLKQMVIDPAAEGCRVVISGHSHKPYLKERGGVLYLNPGSAGPRRFKLPVSIGYLRIRSGGPTAEIVNII